MSEGRPTAPAPSPSQASLHQQPPLSFTGAFTALTHCPLLRYPNLLLASIINPPPPSMWCYYCKPLWINKGCDPGYFIESLFALPLMKCGWHGYQRRKNVNSCLWFGNRGEKQIGWNRRSDCISRGLHLLWFNFTLCWSSMLIIFNMQRALTQADEESVLWLLLSCWHNFLRYLPVDNGKILCYQL